MKTINTRSNKNILMILNNAFTHDARVYQEAKTLIKEGYTVKIIAWDRKRVAQLRETIKGIEIIRIRIPYFLDKIIPFEIFKVPIWQILAYKKALKLYKNWNFQVVHVHDWPDLPIGVLIKKKLKNIKLIYDSHEIWTYMVFTKKFSQAINEAIWREKYLINKYVDVLITVSSGCKKYFLNIFPKVNVILNAKSQTFGWKKPHTKELHVVYIGGFDKHRCILECIRAIERITEKTNKVKAEFAGPYVRGITDILIQSSKDVPSIKYIGMISRDKVLEKSLEGNLIYVVFDRSDPLYKIGMPNKIFEAISIGRAILAGKGTLSGKFVEEYKIGLVVNCNVEEIKKALINFIENPKLIVKFGKRAYKIGHKYNWEIEEKKLLKIYQEITGEM